MNLLGGGLSVIGGLLGSGSANRRRKELEKVANTPGVDIGSAYSDTLKAGTSQLAGAQELATGMNSGALLDLNSILEMAMPGYGGIQRDRVAGAGALVRGEIPQDVTDAVYRNTAERAVGGGYAGTPMHGNLTARDLGRTSLDLTTLGNDRFESIIGSTPLPRMTQTSDILNVTGRDATTLRSGERSKRLDMLTGKANSPTSTDVLSKMMQDMGGVAMGGGFGSLSSILGSI
ncbi:MAG: hypothetical protein IT581_12090 [Verrucomicrobiales bacterium]|nr:hypothetical protein [Verrucomicrobiales bacterium]